MFRGRGKLDNEDKILKAVLSDLEGQPGKLLDEKLVSSYTL